MTDDKQLGLDELMIVNPGTLGARSLFLGEDGVVYQLQGYAEAGATSEVERFYLGENGRLYQADVAEGDNPTGIGVPEAATDTDKQMTGRFFLGEDGRLYERVS
ncbi:hypothetical protein QZJ86_10245 [Methylomonas montana]|uniref:hypothetical protein n=1 Tax=Methylomonas montana TaxID=3058963 RepID=UPI0026593248|nr:hypothetical protein [Methylomonas montana]WKJ92499.1 hypothetical protein QZJ86_10245 [Methylomonas montana]